MGLCWRGSVGRGAAVHTGAVLCPSTDGSPVMGYRGGLGSETAPGIMGLELAVSFRDPGNACGIYRPEEAWTACQAGNIDG